MSCKAVLSGILASATVKNACKPSIVLRAYSARKKCAFCISNNRIRLGFKTYSSSGVPGNADLQLECFDINEGISEVSSEIRDDNETEIDRLWTEKITNKAKSSRESMPRAIERYELETLYDVYKEQNPTLNDEGLAKVYQYVEKLINYAYEDKAPPEMSIAQLEDYMRFEEERAQDEQKAPEHLYLDESDSSYNPIRVKKPCNSVEGYLSFLYKTHWKKMRGLERKNMRSKRLEETSKPDLPESWLRAFSKTHQRHVKMSGESKLAAAARTGIPLVLDMSYDHLMNIHEKKEMARQIIAMSDLLSKIPEPFHLYLTNYQPGNVIWNYLEQTKTNLSTTPAPITKVFPVSKLIYLSPDATEDLEDFKPDDILVVGGMVDKSLKKNASLIHAKRLGIRCAKFPLSDNARVIASKPLNFLEVLNILHRFTYHKDIHRALCEGISKRRHRHPSEAEEIVRNQVRKAGRLIGEPAFVHRERARARKRLEVVERMNALGSEKLRQKYVDPHSIDAWL